MPFPPSAACRFFDLPPVNLQNLPLHLTKNSFASAPTHLCGIALDVCGAKKVLENFGAPRVLLVLANTVQQKAWDGRFSVENRKWAQTYELPVDEELAGDRRSAYVVQSHPAVLDGFIQQTRRLVQERELQQNKVCLQDKLHPAKLPAQPKKSRAAAQER